MAQIVGKRNFKAFTKAIEQAFKAMDLSYPAIKQVSDIWHINAGSRLPAYFNAITKKVDKTIAEKNAAGGFIDLNQSYKVIIGNMDKEGVRIADIAKAEGMSKQAVSLLAIKTIDAGYIEKSSNPNDARSQKLMLTEKGMRVIILSMKNLVVMEKELSLKIGHQNFQQLMTQSIRLADYYGPETLKSKTSPTSSLKTERSTSSRSPHTEEPHSVSALIDNWAKQLYALVQDNEDIAMAEVFVQADGRRILRSEVMYYLSNIADFK